MSLSVLFKKKYIVIPIIGIILFVTIYLSSFVFYDNDGAFILATGRYIIENGIPKTNPFHFIEGLEIVVQQWLWTVCCYFIYSKAGKIGIFISCILLYLGTLFVTYQIAKLKKVNKWIALTFISFIYCINYYFITIRPTFITVLLLLTQIYILEKYKQTNKKRILLWLILISFLEINFHSSLWIMHFVFLLPYIVPPIKNPFVKFNDWNRNILPIGVTAIPMFLVGFINPYKIDGILYIFNSYNEQLKSAGIHELKAPSTNSIFTLLAFMFLFVGLHFAFNKKSIAVEPFYIFCGTAILSLMHNRNRIYFYIGVLCLFIELLSKTDFTKLKDFVYRHTKRIQVSAWALFIVLVFLFAPTIPSIANELDEDSASTPVQAVAYLNENTDKNIRLYNEFNNGGFFELQGYQVFIDARPELYFKSFNKKEDIFNDYHSMRNNYTELSEFKTFLDKYNFDYLCVDNISRLHLYLQTDSNFEVVVNTSEYHLYRAIK